METKLEEWRRHRSVGHASDLVGAGITLGREEETADAARFLVQEDLSVTPWARELAKRALTSPEHVETTLEPENVERAIFSERIKTFRNLVRAEPNDPITWVELSRCYTCIGLRDQAARAMMVAQQLARDNRFVIRSASRLWINHDEPDRAHDTILRTDRTRQDPWLLAAEIATSVIAGKSTRLARVAQRMLSNGQYAPVHISELASAVATLELISGRVKKSRRLFKQSLEDPTENSVAQALWASRNHSSISFDDQYLNRPNAFEAEAWSHYLMGEWEQAVEQCKLWLYDQPFSKIPCLLGSSLAATTLEDYSTSEWFANRGLMANPENFSLLNNSAFALANLGKLKEAQNSLSKAAKMQSSLRDKAILRATRGLLEFRTGNLERGREFYLSAQSMAKSIQSRDGDKVFALASAFHAIEEASMKDLNFQPVLSEALQMIRTQQDPEFRVLEQRLIKMA